MVTPPHVGAFLSRLFSEPWLISKEHLHGMIRGQFGPAGGQPILLNPYEADSSAEQAPEYFDRIGGTAVISICGPILKNPDYFDRKYLGACDVDEVRLAADLARMDETVERVFLMVRSPGGTATGVPECGQALAELREAKPLYGFTDTCACSAGYWLLAQAQGIYMTSSARVGSIGAYAIYEDLTKWLEEMGVKVNAISTGRMKLAGAPFKEMTDEEREYFQAGIDRIGTEFREAVQATRTLAPEAMEGQGFAAEEAIEAGLCDGMVRDFHEALQVALNTGALTRNG